MPSLQRLKELLITTKGVLTTGRKHAADRLIRVYEQGWKNRTGKCISCISKEIKGGKKIVGTHVLGKKSFPLHFSTRKKILPHHFVVKKCLFCHSFGEKKRLG